MSRIIMFSLQSSSFFFFFTSGCRKQPPTSLFFWPLRKQQKVHMHPSPPGVAVLQLLDVFKNFPGHMTPIKAERKNGQRHTVYTQKHIFHTEGKDGFKPSEISKQNNPIIKSTRWREALKLKRVCIVDRTMEPVIKIKKYRNIQTCFYSCKKVAGKSRSFF